MIPQIKINILIEIDLDISLTDVLIELDGWYNLDGKRVEII